MGYYLTTEPENAVPGKSWVMPKTHTPGSPVKERGLRFYSAEAGRWTSRDPVGMNVSEEAISLYVYCANKPATVIDILGLWVWTYNEVDMGGNTRKPEQLPDGGIRYGHTTPVWDVRSDTSPCGGASLRRADAAGDLKTVFWWTPGIFPPSSPQMSVYNHEKTHVNHYKNRWNQLEAYLGQYFPTPCICPAKAECMEDLAKLAGSYYYLMAQKESYTFDCAQGSTSSSYNSCALAATTQTQLQNVQSQLDAKVKECNQ